jgi:transcriptional regulator with XRE-family HTH domain
MAKIRIDDPPEIVLLKARLSGPNLNKLLKEKNITKYALHRATGISYQTIQTWAHGRGMPSKQYAIIVGQYLGIISPSETEIVDLKNKIADLSAQLKRIERNRSDQISIKEGESQEKTKSEQGFPSIDR